LYIYTLIKSYKRKLTKLNKKRLGYILLSIIGIISIIALIVSDVIVQDENYHHFSDEFTIFKIPNFWNVISNIPFLIVGILGFFHLKKKPTNSLQYIIFFTGITLVAVGSGYYHINPTSETLIWDRLPMTFAFMALFSIVISEFIDDNKGKKFLFLLLLFGVISIVYWIGFNDLRLYVLVQFYPILAIPIILLLFNTNNKSTKAFWLLLVAYVMAKLLETYDFEIHNKLTLISGHSLKHVIAAIGVYVFIKYSFKNIN